MHSEEQAGNELAQQDLGAFAQLFVLANRIENPLSKETRHQREEEEKEREDA